MQLSFSDCLISIMDILGCLSISSTELKQLIGLFHIKTGENKVRFVHVENNNNECFEFDCFCCFWEL